MAKRVLKILATLAVLVALIGCSAMDAGSRRARGAAVTVGNRVEQGADDLARKGRTFWQWLTGQDEKPRRKTASGSTADSSRTKPIPPATTLATKPVRYVGTER